MSVVAWDGKTLAADKRACVGSLVHVTTKIFRVGEALAGYAGDADAGEELLAWFRDGHDPATFPAAQRSKEGWTRLLVVWPNGDIWTYERTPYPLKFPPQQFAIGSGRDFAMAAMHCGKTALGAVGVACALDNGCGNGFDMMTHEVAGSNPYTTERAAVVKLTITSDEGTRLVERSVQACDEVEAERRAIGLVPKPDGERLSILARFSHWG